MSAAAIPIEALLVARERMILEIQRGIDAEERRFLLSLVAGSPEWQALSILRVQQSPGIRWKLDNLLQLQKRNPERFAEQSEALEARLASLPLPTA